MTLFADLVATSNVVASTSSRLAKTEAMATLLRVLDAGEVAVVATFLAGDTRQSRLGVGWAAVTNVAIEPATGPSLSVCDVDATFDRLASTTGPGSVGARADLLSALFAAATAPEADYLRGLLSGGVRHGALAGLVADAVAKASGVRLASVRRAVMLGGDLGDAARIAMSHGEPGLAAVGLVMGRPIQPMLASTAAEVGSALAAASGPVSVEWKLDGIRIQAHKRGDEVSLFTRNLNEITSRFPDLVNLVRSLNAVDAVLDGEVIGIGPDDASPELFQVTAGSFATDHGPDPGVDRSVTLRAYFFDIMHADGVDLIDEPLDRRHEVLDRVVGGRAVPRLRTEDPAEAGAFAADALARGHEGVMVKSATSRYEAGRRGKTWRKVKPVITLDLVVLGAEWGHGRRQGWLSNLHLGARNPHDAGGFVMVGKTFKGLTDDLLSWQTAALLEREVQRKGITVFVRPELVVEIAVDGVQISRRYPGGVALRFARVKRYRPDKMAGEADTIESVQALLATSEAAAT